VPEAGEECEDVDESEEPRMTRPCCRWRRENRRDHRRKERRLCGGVPARPLRPEKDGMLARLGKGTPTSYRRACTAWFGLGIVACIAVPIPAWAHIKLGQGEEPDDVNANGGQGLMKG
jgi:hypothetical protein